MTPPTSADRVQQFKAHIEHRLGLLFDDSRLDFLTDILARRLKQSGLDCDTYLARLESGAPAADLGALAQELTIAETYFFRNIDQFHALAGAALPHRLQARAGQGRLQVLSAGCASGEEAYTIAMLARQALSGSSWQIAIRAVDVNPAMIERAQRARYTDWSLRETPADVRQRWFRRDGRDMVLADEIRSAVTFEVRNLIEEDFSLWSPGVYDVVFCRNVLMYLTPGQARGVVRRIARALAPGGYLFLGHAETLRNLSEDFNLCHTHGTFYYQHREGGEARELSAVLPTASRGFSWNAPAPALAAVLQDDSWVETIRQSTERIERLVRAPKAAAADMGWDAAQALELLHQERFAEALTLVQAASEQEASTPEVLLLSAVLLTHGGLLQEAEGACRRLLDFDARNAGAHYVLALCCEGAADADGAADHYQVAATLDPSFAMPRLHLGLQARRSGDHEAARRELQQALILLQREQASRLLLFGGGFGREALAALCRAELRACGAPA
ncbi:MAG TPA: CheR family methyltransferase [Burkholderiaceae bacterium]|nr:CheR family methyltransferase [Burkholderiaceae bacterium]